MNKELEYNRNFEASTSDSFTLESEGNLIYIEIYGDENFDGTNSTIELFESNGSPIWNSIEQVIPIQEDLVVIKSALIYSKSIVIQYGSGDATAGNVEIKIWQI